MKKVPAWLKSLFIFVIIYLFVIQPIPYYIEKPGTAFGLDDMVAVDGQLADDPGEFYITTVGIQQATPLTALSSLLPYRDLLSEQELFGDMSDYEEYDVIQNYYMKSSSNTAIQVAFEAAELEYDLVYNGIYVLQVVEKSNFYGKLKVGDTVKAVDQNHFQSSQEFIDYVSQQSVGDTVEIEFERNGELDTVTGELIQLETGAVGIGIGLVDNSSLVTDPKVEIHSEGIGGPSAGLMFSLQILNQLISEDILGTHKIAGTGTIAPDGTVGRIGGIAKKIVAADEAGAAYFFAPDDEIPAEITAVYPEIQSNYDEALIAAEDIGTEMKVIPVKTFEDALEFLDTIKEKETSKHDNWKKFSMYNEQYLFVS